jgi:hypothetical protein
LVWYMKFQTRNTVQFSNEFCAYLDVWNIVFRQSEWNKKICD